MDERGGAIEVSDPLAAELRALCDANAGNCAAMVKAVIGVEKIFGTDLLCEPRFVDTTVAWLEKFYVQGVLKTLQAEFSSHR